MRLEGLDGQDVKAVLEFRHAVDRQQILGRNDRELASQDLASAARAGGIIGAVMASCRLAASGVLPQTPILVQPLPPAVCSHWKQNMLMGGLLGLFSKLRVSGFGVQGTERTAEELSLTEMHRDSQRGIR